MPPTGPQAGPQPNIKYCPECKCDLDNIASNKQQPPDSHLYKCKGCGKTFEINTW